MSAKASIPPGALAQNLLATIDASADPTRPPIHPDTLALYDLWLASGANTAAPPPASSATAVPPADPTATASDSAMESAPTPMESDEDQDDESVPEVPGTTI